MGEMAHFYGNRLQQKTHRIIGKMLLQLEWSPAPVPLKGDIYHVNTHVILQVYEKNTPEI